MKDVKIFDQCFRPSNLATQDAQDVQIKGNYAVANLLQLLFLAQQRGEKFLELNVSQLTESPVHRLEKLIRDHWWDNLTRTIDAAGIAKAALDTKAEGTEQSPRRLYVPTGAPDQYIYFTKIAENNPNLYLDIQWFPEGSLTPELVHDLDDKPGLLALEMVRDVNDPKGSRGLPFIVPGGRFNELYYWDSAFCAWGMLGTHNEVVKAMLMHFIFQIKHYGKICNANRSYYLGRAQPPFLTTLALRTYEATRCEADAKARLESAILAAMKEYHNYWMTPPRYDEETGINRYRPIGAGFPPECEATQFDHVLAPFAKKYEMSSKEVMELYNGGKIEEPDLDTFTLHDRSVRESGHDTSNRVEGVCADLGTIDLQCLLYKYEVDIAKVIRDVFDDQIHVPSEFCTPEQDANHAATSAPWVQAAKQRKQVIDKFCWNEEKGMYFDYNTKTKQQMDFESATTLWPLWCGVASQEQAAKLVHNALPKLECIGGLSSTSRSCRGIVSDSNPQKQWDYPNGWPPHQMLAWEGLKKYGYHEEAERLIYRWLHMIIKVFVDHNGTVVEKYNVTTLDAPHKVDAEYGNQGLNFKYAPQEG